MDSNGPVADGTADAKYFQSGWLFPVVVPLCLAYTSPPIPKGTDRQTAFFPRSGKIGRQQVDFNGGM